MVSLPPPKSLLVAWKSRLFDPVWQSDRWHSEKETEKEGEGRQERSKQERKGQKTDHQIKKERGCPKKRPVEEARFHLYLFNMGQMGQIINIHTYIHSYIKSNLQSFLLSLPKKGLILFLPCPVVPFCHKSLWLNDLVEIATSVPGQMLMGQWDRWDSRLLKEVVPSKGFVYQGLGDERDRWDRFFTPFPYKDYCRMSIRLLAFFLKNYLTGGFQWGIMVWKN